MKTGFPVHNTIPLRKDAAVESQEQDRQLRDAAKLYERQFVNEMVKAMRATVSHSDLTEPTMAEKIYQDQMFDSYVDSWTERGGLGLADMIYDKLKTQVENWRNGPGEKPQGPLPLSNPQPVPLPTPTDLRIETQTRDKDSFGVLFEKSAYDGGAYPVMAPWGGRVANSFRTAEGRSVIQLDHGQGVRSQIAYLGTLRDGLAEVSPGEVIGAWAPEGRSLHWSVRGERA
jgi:hypothetical protein